MFKLPWGIILLIPLAWLLFRNKGRYIAQVFGYNRQGMLWWLFFILLGSFFNITAGIVRLNAGALLTLVLAGKISIKYSAKEWLRAFVTTLATGLYAYAFSLGSFWWLAKLSLPTDWLLPALAGCLGILLAGKLKVAITGLTIGLTFTLAIAGYQLNDGLIWELGSFATLNMLVVSLFVAGGIEYLKIRKQATNANLVKNLRKAVEPK